MNIYIVIPTYNEEAYLNQTLQSLVAQTVRPSKVVVVNDNSTDNTHEKYNELTKTIYNKSNYIHNSKKYGQAFNRYRAYNMCEDYEYCIMLDGDDWLANKYVLQYLCLSSQSKGEQHYGQTGFGKTTYPSI